MKMEFRVCAFDEDDLLAPFRPSTFRLIAYGDNVFLPHFKPMMVCHWSHLTERFVVALIKGSD
jgi:hypothetical protein